MYHVSPHDFNEFSLDYFGGTDEGSICKGLYFENKPNTKYGSKAYEVYLDIQNPFYYKDNPRRFSINFRDLGNKEKIKQQKEQITQELIQEGYDSVIMYDTQFVVFDPKQIRIAKKYDV